MTDKPTTVQELEELCCKVDFEKLMRDEILKKVQKKSKDNMIRT